MKKILALLLFVLLVIVSLSSLSLAEAQGGKPPNQPKKGLIYDGLDLPSDGSCKGSFKLQVNSKKETHCTHGPDVPSNQMNVAQDVAPVLSPAPAGVIPCDGDGVSGKRVQIIYTYAAGTADRYNTYLQSFQTWAAEAEAIFNDSAKETGGTRHIRFVHDSKCMPTILKVQLSATGNANLANTVSELMALGFNAGDRKYMVFADTHVYCGIGDIAYDDQPGPMNASNVSLSFSRIDNGCWSGLIAAHELMHNLGGVQLSAPHSSGGWHCTDGYDRMCYSDAPYYPTIQSLCQDPMHARLFDCNHDDYYSTNPPAGSYLATHWNVANSLFLIGTPAPRLVHLDSLATGSYRGRTFITTDTFKRKSTVVIRIHAADQNNASLSGVTVQIQLMLPNGSAGYTRSAVTDVNGIVEIPFTLESNDPRGTWDVHVSNMSKPDYTASFASSVLDKNITHQ